MTNEELFEDFKQLLTTTVAQTETRLNARFDELSDKMDSGFEGVGEATEAVNDRLDTRDAEVEQRLTRLEQKAA